MSPARRAKHKTVRRAKWMRPTDRWMARSTGIGYESFRYQPYMTQCGCWCGRRGEVMGATPGEWTEVCSIAQAAASLRRIIG